MINFYKEYHASLDEFEFRADEDEFHAKITISSREYTEDNDDSIREQLLNILQKEKAKKIPRVYYLCDRRACERCFEDCCATTDISHAVNFHRTELGGYCENGSNIKSIEDQVKNDNESPIEEPKKEVTLNPYGQYVLDFAKNHDITIEEAYNQPMVKARLAFFNTTGR